MARSGTAKDFWEKVRRTSTCWLWTGKQDKDGYGVLSRRAIKRTIVRAHRYSWKLERGEIPKGISVLHKCDTRNCVRPSHLFLGTQKDNVADMYRKGRGAKGEMRGSAKLSVEDVMLMRDLHASGYQNSYLSKMFSVAAPTVSMIVRRLVWRHV